MLDQTWFILHEQIVRISKKVKACVFDRFLGGSGGARSGFRVIGLQGLPNRCQKAAMLSSFWSLFGSMFLSSAGKIALILNVTMMIVGFYVAKFFASDVAQRRCISLECGLQNGTLAVFVGTQLFGTNMTYMVPTAAYALIMMLTSLLFVFILRRQS